MVHRRRKPSLMIHGSRLLLTGRDIDGRRHRFATNSAGAKDRMVPSPFPLRSAMTDTCLPSELAMIWPIRNSDAAGVPSGLCGRALLVVTE